MGQFRGGTRPNRFRVILTYPGLVGSPNVQDEIVVTAASIPESTIGRIDVPYMGRTIPLPGTRQFPDWTISVTNDTTFSHRNAFEKWLNALNAHEGNTQATLDTRALMATLDVAQLDLNSDNVLKNYKFYNAFPTNLSPIDLSYSNNDQLSSFSVTFAYSHWGANTTT